MTKFVAPTLDFFAEVTGQEREILLETFRVWLDGDGSLCATGELQICRPNTVRYRLHKSSNAPGGCFHGRETWPNCRWL
jgi:sugar diacid utilization regulator